MAFQLGVDDPSEASLDLSLADLRLKAGKLPTENFRRTQKNENGKSEKLEAIKALSQSEDVLKKAEAETHDKEVEMNNVIISLPNLSIILL